MENIENSQEVIGSRIADSNYGNVVGESTLATRNSKEAVSEELKSSTLLESPHNKTYIEIIAEKDNQGQPLSVLEVDLIISREKGRETRRLSMNFAGIDMEKKEMVEKSINIDRESFEQLKQFFSNLDWNS
jgi:hypothetical protein